MSTNEKTTNPSAAADIRQPAPAILAPEEIVDQLRAISTSQEAGAGSGVAGARTTGGGRFRNVR